MTQEELRKSIQAVRLNDRIQALTKDIAELSEGIKAVTIVTQSCEVLQCPQALEKRVAEIVREYKEKERGTLLKQLREL